MKLTKLNLRHIIKEEVQKYVNEEDLAAEPFSDEEQTQHSEAYYELWDFLATSSLPGNKPSEKLESALRWIAKFEEYDVDLRRTT